jgi:hypothetical protein
MAHLERTVPTVKMVPMVCLERTVPTVRLGPMVKMVRTEHLAPTEQTEHPEPMVLMACRVR